MIAGSCKLLASCRTEQNRTEQSRTEQNITEQNRAGHKRVSNFKYSDIFLCTNLTYLNQHVYSSITPLFMFPLLTTCCRHRTQTPSRPCGNTLRHPYPSTTAILHQKMYSIVDIYVNKSKRKVYAFTKHPQLV